MLRIQLWSHANVSMLHASTLCAPMDFPKVCRTRHKHGKGASVETLTYLLSVARHAGGVSTLPGAGAQRVRSVTQLDVWGHDAGRLELFSWVNAKWGVEVRRGEQEGGEDSSSIILTSLYKWGGGRIRATLGWNCELDSLEHELLNTVRVFAGLIDWIQHHGQWIDEKAPFGLNGIWASSSEICVDTKPWKTFWREMCDVWR